MIHGMQSLLSVEEASRRLGVSLSTVWRRIRRGELASVRKGGRRWVPARSIERAGSPTEQIPPITPDHPIFRLAGAYRSGGKGAGSGDKHAILAERR
jgi:excisionase family DNA binding protein